MKTTLDDIINAIDKYNGTIVELAKKAGVSRKTIYDLKNRTYSNLGYTTFHNICTALGLETPPEKYWGIREPMPHPALRPIATKKYRVLGDIACGQPIEANEEYDLYVDAGSDIKADFVLRARGDSMIGARIQDKDYVFIRQCDTAEHRGIYAVSLNGEVTLKRVLFHPKDNPTMIALKAENPAYDDIIISGAELDTLHIVGKAVAFQSDVR